MYLLQSKSIKSDELLPHAIQLPAHKRILLVNLAKGGAEREVLHHLPHANLQPRQLSVQVTHLWVPWHLLKGSQVGIRYQVGFEALGIGIFTL